MKSRKDFESDEEYNRYLRMCIAMAAMQGILANHSSIDRGISAVLKGTTDGLAGHVAGMAIEYADELLKQLES